MKSGAALLALAAGAPAGAETSDPPPSRFDVSLSVWESTGGSTWSHDASAAEPLFGDPTSRLEYDAVDSTIAELRARIDLGDGLAAELAYGAGNADNGRLTDEDFVSAGGAEFFGTAVAGEHAYSETESALNGDHVSYIDVALEKELYRSAGDASRAGIAARYLHWTEKYDARGVDQIACTAPGRLCAPVGTSRFEGQSVITNDARWQALFIGAWGRHALTDRLSLSGSLGYSPLVVLDSDDRHFRRFDLAQSPSFRHEGNGQAATAELRMAYRFTRRLSAGLGLRYWWMKITNEARGFTVFPVDGEPFSTPLRRFETERYGVTATLTYTFSP